MKRRVLNLFDTFLADFRQENLQTFDRGRRSLELDVRASTSKL